MYSRTNSTVRMECREYLVVLKGWPVYPLLLFCWMEYLSVSAALMQRSIILHWCDAGMIRGGAELRVHVYVTHAHMACTYTACTYTWHAHTRLVRTHGIYNLYVQMACQFSFHESSLLTIISMLRKCCQLD